jgi:uncharacterized membrane protein YdjX (TVP38/TMEM64 family)
MSEMVAKTSMAEVKMEKSGVSVGRVVLLTAAVVGLILLGRQGGAYIPIFAEWVKSLGVWGPVAFIAGYVVATVLFIPGSLLTLAGGAIFGLTKGVMIVFLAAVLGSSAAFLVSRYVARSSIERRLAGNARFAAIDRAVGVQGRKIVFLLRLSPVFPFTLLNYGLGLTNVRFVDYVIASIGMLPGTLLYVYYGKVIGDVAALAGGTAMEKGPADYAILILGLAATIVVTTIVTRIARRALGDVTKE